MSRILPPTILPLILLPLVILLSAAVPAQELANPGFENWRDGSPVGWTVLSGLDDWEYGGEREDWHTFDLLEPTASYSPRSGKWSLGYPSQGVWHVPVYAHSRGNGVEGNDGRARGKAAAHQTVELGPGEYRFAAWLRTRLGALYSAGFSLGIQEGEAEYADDDATGIRWSERNLAEKTALTGTPEATGDWQREFSPALVVEETGPVTVWIRFNYLNENQMNARWQVDDTALVRQVVEPVDPAPAPDLDTYGEWYGVTDLVLVNPRFEDGPADHGGPFGWDCDGDVALAEGYRGMAAAVGAGGRLSQQIHPPMGNADRKWRGEIWIRYSDDASRDAVLVFAEGEGDGEGEGEHRVSLDPADREEVDLGLGWNYVPLPEVKGWPVTRLTVVGPTTGTVWIDAVTLEKEGKSW